MSVNRLTLHLRSYSPETGFGDFKGSMTTISANRQRRSSWLGASTLEVRDLDSSNDIGLNSFENMHRGHLLDLPVNRDDVGTSSTT